LGSLAQSANARNARPCDAGAPYRTHRPRFRAGVRRRDCLPDLVEAGRRCTGGPLALDPAAANAVQGCRPFSQAFAFPWLGAWDRWRSRNAADRDAKAEAACDSKAEIAEFHGSRNAHPRSLRDLRPKGTETRAAPWYSRACRREFTRAAHPRSPQSIYIEVSRS